MIDIAVIFPSRGLLYTETLKEVLEELEPYKHRIYWSHGRSLPACFNRPLAEALKNKHSHVWFVEDDMVIPKGTLKALLDAKEEMIACDYPITANPSGTVLYDPEGEAYFTGTGCLLAKHSVLKEMRQVRKTEKGLRYKPFFRSDIEWHFGGTKYGARFIAHKADPEKVYGYHDVSFGLKRYIMGKPIKVSKIICAQRKLEKKGTAGSNEGADVIRVIDKYKPLDYIAASTQEKPEKSYLKLVMLDGRPTNMSNTLADKLIAEGKATEVVKSIGYLTLDFTDTPYLAKEFI